MTETPRTEAPKSGWKKRTEHDRSGSETHHRIVDAARRVIEEVGYDKASVERIAKAAGTSRPTFYVYFNSRREVFRFVAEDFIESALETIQMRGLTASPQVIIRHTIAETLRLFSENLKLLAAIEQQSVTDNHVRTLWDDFRSRQIRYSENFIAALQDRGLADHDADAYAASECLTLLILHFAREWETGTDVQHVVIVDRLVYLYHRLTGYALPDSGAEEG